MCKIMKSLFLGVVLLVAHVATAMDSTNSTTRQAVFVKEFCGYAKNFAHDATPVAAIDVSTCYLVEISNRDAGGKRTAFALAHIKDESLQLQDSFRVTMLTIKKLLSAFKNQGGDVKSAKVRIFGGTHIDEYRGLMRKALTLAIIGVFLETEHVKPTIEEPKNHHMNAADLSIDYLFYKDRVEFRKMIDVADESKDVFSTNLSAHAQRNKFIGTMDSYRTVSRELDSQTCNMVAALDLALEEMNSCDRTRYTELSAHFIIHLVDEDGLIKREEYPEVPGFEYRDGRTSFMNYFF